MSIAWSVSFTLIADKLLLTFGIKVRKCCIYEHNYSYFTRADVEFLTIKMKAVVRKTRTLKWSGVVINLGLFSDLRGFSQYL